MLKLNCYHRLMSRVIFFCFTVVGNNLFLLEKTKSGKLNLPKFTQNYQVTIDKKVRVTKNNYCKKS